MGSYTPSNVSNFQVTSNGSVNESIREIQQALQVAEETKTINDLLRKQVSETASCTTSIESMDRKFNHWIANIDTTNLFPDRLNQEIHRHKMEQDFADNISSRVESHFKWLCGFVNEVASFWKPRNEMEKRQMRMERLNNFWNEMKPSNAEINELVQRSQNTCQPSTSKYGQNIPFANTSSSKPATASEKRSRSITPPPPENPPQMVLPPYNQTMIIRQPHPSNQVSNLPLEKIRIHRHKQ